jgi:KaiC/GvpD/RAD55 family RecA-like ATPase
MSNKEIALSYLRKGFSVIPLWSQKQIKRKPPSYFVKELNDAIEKNENESNPLSDDEIYEKYVTRVCKKAMIKWSPYQKKLPDERKVSEWFSKWPDANIGIVTGKISNLVVFDLDSEDAVDYANAEGGFPLTAKVKTGKGYHIYVKHPGFNVKNDAKNKNELDIDIRGDGGYAVAPPSVHGSGVQYMWEDGLSIREIDPAPCEPWMEDYLKILAQSSSQSKQQKQTTSKPSKTVNTASKSKAQDDYAEILNNGAVEGMRNHTATKLIGHLFGKGNDEAVVWEMVKQWNSSKIRPPLDETELRKSFDSIRKLHGKNGKKEPEKKDIDVKQFLDTQSRVAAEYDEQYFRVPFAGPLLPIMESKMNGGLIGGRIYVIGGIPSASKTTLANNLTDNICLNGHPVLFFSYDDGRTELRYRSYSRFSGFDIEEFNNRRLSKSDVEAIYRNDSISSISKLKYTVQEILKVEDWGQLIDKIHVRHKKAPVVMIDYLRKVKTESNRMDERLRVDEILSALTNMAKNYNIPVLVISELARDSYKTGQRLSMASFKESGTIEYEASWLGILAAVEDDGAGYKLKNDWERIINQDGNIDLIVFKAKRGTGVTGRIALKLEKSKMTVRDRIEATKSDGVTPLRRASKFD